MDSKLRKHSFDLDCSATVSYVKLLLTNMSLVPAGFVPKLVYHRRMLSDDETLGSIAYSPERSISLVCVRSTPASTAANPELPSSRPTKPNPSGTAAALHQDARASSATAACCSAADATTAAADVSALSQARPVFSIGFDEEIVQDVLTRAGGDQQSAIRIAISGQLHDSPAVSSSRDATVPVIFSMGFDDASVQRTLASVGGDEERAADLFLSGSQSSSGNSFGTTPGATTSAALPAAISSNSGPISCSQGHTCLRWTYTDVHSCNLQNTEVCINFINIGEQGYRCDDCDHDVCLPCYRAAAPVINFATEWLDEHDYVCPKIVDYATQCPKGHALVHLIGGGGYATEQRLMCRICHEFAECEHASQWLICSVKGCCAGYCVCNYCISTVQQAPAIMAAGEALSTLVKRTATSATSWVCLHLLLQGVSLEYLRWMQAEFGSSLDRLTTSQFEKMYLRPQTSRRRCSVTEELAAHAATAHYVGPATWFISHTWSNPFTNTLGAILHFFEGRADSANAVLWFDIFVDSQHADEGPSKPPQWYMTTFKSSIARIGRLLLVVDAWNNPTALRRAW